MSRKQRLCIYITGSCISLGCLAAGHYFDLPAARLLYSADNTAAAAVAFAASYTFMASCVLFLGVLFRQFMNTAKRRPAKGIISAAFIYLFASTATLGGATFLNDPLTVQLSGGFTAGYINSLIAGSLLFGLFFILGMVSNGSRHDKESIKALIKIICLMTCAFLMAFYLNTTITRPDFRSVISGSTESFTAWYEVRNNGKLFMSIHDLICAPQGSFICAHASYAALFLIIFPSWSYAFPSLKGKERLLMALAGLAAMPVMICRMITGDAYLTDTALGAFAGLKMCAAFNGLPERKKILSLRKRN